jgi:hypothetical protein
MVEPKCKKKSTIQKSFIKYYDIHDFNEKNINTCQICKKIFNKYGIQEAQIEEPHFPVPITKHSD